MTTHVPRKPHRHPATPAEDDPEPGMLPVEPDTGPTPPAAPGDAEPDRAVDPQV